MAGGTERRLMVLCETCGHLTPITDHASHVKHMIETHGLRRDRLHLARAKRRPINWHRECCLVHDCAKAVVRAGLCPRHQSELLVEANLDIAAAGGELFESVRVSDGYVMAQRMAGRHEQRGVHVWVMEAVLRRRLYPGENVHHRNGNRSDNRLSNLELWVSSQPAGQRPEDLAAYARELLSRYGTGEERVRYG